MSQVYAIRWSRPDDEGKTVEGWRVCDEPPTPTAPMLFDDGQQASDLAAWLNEHSTTYTYTAERVN